MVSCTVIAVTTDNGWHPKLASVSRSACIPAPPLGSLAAKLKTIGGVSATGMSARYSFRMRFYPKRIGTMTSTETNNFKTYMCLICGFIYDEAAGLPEEGIKPGTRWEDVPINWVCPECGARKDDFELVEI